MSKKQATTAPSISERTKRTIYIAAIIAIAAVIIAISLALILNPGTTTTTPTEIADKDAGVTPSSSSTTVKNGTFEGWTVKQDNTSYPHLANKWWNAFTRNTSETNGSTADKTKLSQVIASDSDDKNVDSFRINSGAVYGIIDTDEDEWNTVTSDLAALNIALNSNPGARPDSDDTKIYMIASNDATSLAVLSQRVTVSGGKYIKVTVRVNTSMLDDGAKAKIALQEGKYYSSSLSISNVDGLYVEKDLAKADGWQDVVFYVFNNSTSKYFNVSINFGDVYKNDVTASGALFVDDITYEAVSSNEYRLHHADTAGQTKVFDAEEKDSEAKEATITDLNGNALTAITGANYLNEGAAKQDGTVYSPFFDDQEIYTVANNGTKDVVGIRLKEIITLKKSDNYTKDCAHISFLLRMNAVTPNTNAKVVVEKVDDAGNVIEDGTVTSATFTVDAVEDIATADANCGWNLYHIYLKPSDYPFVTDKVRVSIYIGAGETSKYELNGQLYVTNVVYEMIDSTTYSNGDSEADSVVKKASMTTDVSSTTVTNGSFSSWADVNNQPASWTPVFGGSNDIFVDGKGNSIATGKDDRTLVAGSGVVQDTTNTPATDDRVQTYLKVTTNDTAFGYMSSSMSLSANKVYLLSVLAKVEGSAQPSIHVVDTSAGDSRTDKVIASITSVATSNKIDGTEHFAETTDENGWTRYYFVIVTGTKTRSVKLVLMNGDILGETYATGTVYYDIAMKTEIGSYSAALENEDDEAKTVTWTANDGYTAFDKLQEIEGLNEKTNITVVQPTQEQWDEIKKLDPVEEDTADDTTTTTPTKSDVDLGLLFSVLSSVLLVAALAVVIILRIFKKRI